MSQSFEGRAFKGASWLALFKLISQIFSWIITIIVARILSPGDYGLMEMSTIITGYAAIFNEMGLGSAIIQRKDVSQKELSSVFWFALGFSLCLGLFCVIIAYPTSLIFHEPRTIPITRTVSVLFILTGLQIVPLGLLQKELEFKKTGFAEMTGVFVSCIAMYVIAKMGGGVWTLIGGNIIRELTKLIMVYYQARWLPNMHFDMHEAGSYIGFGIKVAVGQSLFYVYDKSDKFFAGRAWTAQVLGYYSFALQLAKIPTEKIVVLINQVSFPVFAKYQDDKDKFNRFYLTIIRITSTIVFPVFIGGFLVGQDIIKLLLNEKWYPMIPLFKYLCLAQIMTAVNAINNFVHTSQGRPSWSLYFNAVMAIGMPLSFFLAVKYGFVAIIWPWFTTYMLICIIWIVITIRTIGIGMLEYAGALFPAAAASAVMAAGVIFLSHVFPSGGKLLELAGLSGKIFAGGILYAMYMFLFDRSIINDLKYLKQ